MHRFLDWAAGLLPLVIATLVVAFVLAVLLDRRGFFGGPPRTRRTAQLNVALCLVLALIADVTLTPIQVAPGSTWVQWNFVPFADLANSLGGPVSHSLVELAGVLANVALFMPLGVVATLRFDQPRLTRVVVLGVLLSTAIELTQGVADAGREADITDVIANTAGAAAGYALVRAFQQIRAMRERKPAAEV